MFNFRLEQQPVAVPTVTDSKSIIARSLYSFTLRLTRLHTLQQNYALHDRQVIQHARHSGCPLTDFETFYYIRSVLGMM